MGTVTDLLPADANARTAVHEYGGGAWWLHDGAVFAVDWADQRLRRLRPGRRARRPDPGARRSRGATASPTATSRPTARGSSACASTTRRAPRPPRSSTRSSVSTRGRRASRRCWSPGPDFVAAPRLSPDGRPARLGLPGTTRPCRGTTRCSPCATSRPATRRWSRAGPASRSGSRCGSADGALCIPVRPHRVVEPLPLAPRRRRDPARRHGRRDRAARLAARAAPPRDARRREGGRRAVLPRVRRPRRAGARRHGDRAGHPVHDDPVGARRRARDRRLRRRVADPEPGVTASASTGPSRRCGPRATSGSTPRRSRCPSR